MPRLIHVSAFGKLRRPLAAAAAGARASSGMFAQNRWGGKEAEPGLRFPCTGLPSPKQLTLEQEDVAGTIHVHGVLDDAECRTLIEAVDAAGLELQVSRGPAFGEALRKHQRMAFDDPAFAAALWAGGLGELLKDLPAGRRRPVGLNPNIRIYQYGPGDLFGRHVDGSNDVAVPPGRTEYTLLVYLTGPAEGLVGGETAFYGPGGKELIRVQPRAGSALLHRHGKHCLLHEALPVVEGSKYILRSDVVFA